MSSPMNYVELTEAFLERGDVIERVWALVGAWANENPALDKQAATRSRDGDDSLTKALANGRAYATALAAAMEPRCTCSGITSQHGVDQNDGPDKVWRCDECDRIWEPS